MTRKIDDADRMWSAGVRLLLAEPVGNLRDNLSVFRWAACVGAGASEKFCSSILCTHRMSSLFVFSALPRICTSIGVKSEPCHQDAMHDHDILRVTNGRLANLMGACKVHLRCLATVCTLLAAGKGT